MTVVSVGGSSEIKPGLFLLFCVKKKTKLSHQCTGRSVRALDKLKMWKWSRSREQWINPPNNEHRAKQACCLLFITAPANHLSFFSVFLGHCFLFHPMWKNISFKSERGKEWGGVKLSTKSKLYVHDMSAAKLSAPSVCSASAKLIVVALSRSSFTPFFLLEQILSVLPALKMGKKKLKYKEVTEVTGSCL